MKSRSTTQFLGTLMVAFVTLSLFGCSDSPQPKPEQTSPIESNAPATMPATNGGRPTQLETVELALNWFPEAEHGGFFAAHVGGVFEERGISVKFVPGGPGVPVIQNVASGKMLFGVANADQILLGRAQEADVVAVFAPIQQSPRCIMVHKKSNITKFEELKDMALAISANSTFAQFLKKRVPLTNVQIVPYPGNVAAFLENERFGQQAYSFSEPFVAMQQGGDPHNLMLSDLGFNPYTSVLFTRGEVIAQQPDLVRRVVEACALGWRAYLDNPARTNEHIHTLNSEMGLDILEFGAETLKPLCETSPLSSDSFGEMTQVRWQTLNEQLVEAGALTAGSVDPAQAFDVRFLPINKNAR